jgi:hypothetical protein
VSVSLSNILASCGTNLCLLVSTHDAQLRECCSITNCLPNPAFGPTIVSAEADCALHKITLHFSAPLDPAAPLDGAELHCR